MILQKNSFTYILFVTGLVIGHLIFKTFHQMHRNSHIRSRHQNTIKESSTAQKSIALYNNTLADFLYNEVKILCFVFTHPENHKKKIPHVRYVWARKCNKLIIFSNQEDPSIPELVALNISEGRIFLWEKMVLAMKYVYENYINEYDWFLRTDDDNFMIMENLRYTLYQYNPKTALYMGQRFAVVKEFSHAEEGFMHGAGSILSKKALKKFSEKLLNDSTLCYNERSEYDDLKLGQCLRWNAIFVNVLDELGKKQFFAFSILEHFGKRFTIEWYQKYLWDKVPTGSLDCCSDKLIMLHYIKPNEEYLLGYLIYNVHPFGIVKDHKKELPRKLKLEEIIAASDNVSYAGNYIPHEKIHHIDDDERY